LIGVDGALSWPHGFQIEQNILSASGTIAAYKHPISEVIFVHEGELMITADDQEICVRPGDTATIAAGATRSFANHSSSDVNFLTVGVNI
jgi:uncharacterized cupin superfamily protein